MTGRLVANLATFAVLTVVVVVWAAVSLFGQGDDPAARVEVELAATAGLSAGVDVTYLGQAVGHVEQVALTDDAVQAVAALRRDDLPAEVSATVRRRSAVGEPYLDLAPLDGADLEGATLADGDRIPASRTALPREYSELFASVAELFEAVDADDVGTILTEVTAALDGRSDVLQRVLRDGARVMSTLADGTEVLEAALDEVGALTATLADASGSVVRTFEGLREVGETVELLADGAGDLGCTLVSLRQVADTLDDETLAQLGGVLDDAGRIREIIARARDDRDDGTTWLTVSVLLSERTVGGEELRDDRRRDPHPLEDCEDGPTLTEVDGADAAASTDDRSVPSTDPATSADAVDRPAPEEDDDDLAASTGLDPTGEPLPVVPLLVALAVLAIVGAARPWRLWTGGA